MRYLPLWKAYNTLVNKKTYLLIKNKKSQIINSCLINKKFKQNYNKAICSYSGKFKSKINYNACSRHVLHFFCIQNKMHYLFK